MNNELYHHGVKGMKWGVRRHLANHTSATAMWRGQKAAHNYELRRTRKQLKKQFRSGEDGSLTKAEYKSKISSLRTQRSVERGKTLVNGNQTYGKVIAKGVAKQVAFGIGSTAVAGMATGAGLDNVGHMVAVMSTPVSIVMGVSDARKLIDIHSYNTKRYSR